MSYLKKKIFVAGHKGMVGSAILRELKRKSFKNIITISKNKLDLTNQKSEYIFKNNKIDEVYLVLQKLNWNISQ